MCIFKIAPHRGKANSEALANYNDITLTCILRHIHNYTGHFSSKVGSRFNTRILLMFGK